MKSGEIIYNSAEALEMAQAIIQGYIGFNKKMQASILGFRTIIKDQELLAKYDEWFGIISETHGRI